MIRHVVLARLQPDSADRWASVMQSLAGLVDDLDGAGDLVWGPNVSPEAGMDQGFRDGFTIDFVDASARDAYLVDPRHVALAEQIVALTDGGTRGVVVLDLEIPDA